MAVQVGIEAGNTGVRRVAVELRWGKATVVEAPRQATEVLAVPSVGMTFRNLSFPFHDRGRLHHLVAQELEDSLAFPLTDAVWDFAARPASEEAPDNVFAVACPRTRLTQALQAVTSEEPPVVDVEPYAYQRILALAGRSEGLILDLGASRTTTCRIRAGHLDHVRGLQRGGNALTDALAASRKASRPEAEKLKHQKGLELNEVRDFYDRLLEDALLPQEPPTTPLFVTGGGSQTPGLLEWLGSRLKRPVEPLPLPEGVAPDQAVAFGMALWGGKGCEGVNLQSGLKSSTSQVVRIALWVGLILALFSLDRAVTSFMLSREVARYDRAITAVVKKAAPKANVTYKPLDTLRHLVDEQQHGGGSGKDILHILQLVGKSLKGLGPGVAQVNDLSVIQGVAKIRGEATNFQNVQALQDGLSSLGQVAVETNASPSSNKVAFTLSVVLEHK